MSFSTLSAQVCGIAGLVCLAAFIIGGKNDDDGQGVNQGPKKEWE